MSENKILQDLRYLNTMNDFAKVSSFVTETFGIIEHNKTIEYPNEVKVMIYKEEDSIIVAATQKEKQIFGANWQLVKKE